MADVFDPAKRSEVMSKIRSKNTKAELIAFRYLRQQKIYFQKHYARAPGKPDIALPRKKKAVFINGDFWHGKTYDRVLKNHGPGSYWVLKITRNMERDKQQLEELRHNGWSVLVVWEDDILRKSIQTETLILICDFLTD